MFEADESDGSFLLARPAVGVITNVEVDHVDFYPGGREEIERAFAEFARAASAWSPAATTRAPAGARARGRRGDDYGWGPTPICLAVDELGPGGARGTVRAVEGPRDRLALQVDGAHNLLDAAAA